MTTRNMISFDWAIKRLLRNKANFGVLEGFLSELLRRKIIIKHIGESEGNQEEENDKYNRVDIFVEADNKELVIIELQFYSQADYFHRMLYGVSKSITEHIHKGEPYDKVRKIYSINIVYFDLGKGEDYVYHGYTNFKGLHTNDELQLDEKQRSVYDKIHVGDLHPEYYIIKVNNFDNVAKDSFDEWMYYLKNDKIRDDFTAQGLKEAARILAYDNMSEEEKRRYDREIEITRIKDSEIRTAFSDGRYEGRAEGRAEGFVEGETIGLEKGEIKKTEEFIINSRKAGLSIEMIATITSLTVEQVYEILKKHKY